MDSIDQAASMPGTMTLREFLAILWRGKWLAILMAIVFSLVAGVAAWLTPASYTATTLLSPVTNSSGGSQLGVLGSAVSQLGGLASLAGIGAGDMKKSESIAYLQSEALTERYIVENNLLPVLYKKQWDPAKNTWKTNDPDRMPSPWKANQYFKKKVRSVVTDVKSGLVTLTIKWTDPKTAAQWANDLVRITNDHLRSRAIAESERSIAYLNDEAAKTNVVEARQVIYKVLENEISKIVFAKGNVEYAFKVIDPAVTAERPSSFPVWIWLVGGAIVGLLLSIPILLFKAHPATSTG
jgi:uncharacterized protein involved in exopolysaccharide biosynthesis